MTAKPGMNGFGNRLMEILAQADRAARVDGSGRRVIASRLGVSEHTLAAWFKPSRVSMIPADRLFELVCRDDLLPAAVRDALWASLGVEGGYVVVPDATSESNGHPPLVQLAELAAAVGRLAASLHESHANGRTAKAEPAPGAIAQMIGQLHEVGRRAVQMRVGLEEASRKKNGARPERGAR